jgi:hypothetical protein
VLIASSCHSLGTGLKSSSQGISEPDPGLRTLLAGIEEREHGVLIVTRATGRVEAAGLLVSGDSVALAMSAHPNAIAMVAIDSVWERRSAAGLAGVITGVPCAIFFGMVGQMLGADNGGNDGTRGFLIGVAGGGALCGSFGAVLGSFIPRWHLKYAR